MDADSEYSGKLQSWSKIIDYVDEKNSELADLLRQTCADMTLGSTRGKNGITFLMPVDPTYIKKISDLAYSPNEKDNTKACEMLNALILCDVFKTAVEFRGKQVANSLFPSQLLAVKVGGSKVEFTDSGATAEIDKSFKDASKRANLAVWKLTGEIPVTTDKPAKTDAVRPKNKGKANETGGSAEDSYQLRGEIIAKVEREYTDRGKNDPYIKTTASLVQYLAAADALGDLASSLGRDKVDLYYLVYGCDKFGQFLVSDAFLSDWWKGGKISKAPSNINEFYDKLLKPNQDQLTQASVIRKKLLGDSRLNDRSNVVSVIEGVYKDVYGDQAADKMFWDDLRFMACMKFSQIMNMIRDAIRDKKCILLNPTIIKSTIDFRARIEQIKRFINSTAFLRVHMTTTEAKELPKSTTDARSDNEKMVLNLASIIYGGITK